MLAPYDGSRQTGYRTERKGGAGFFILLTIAAFAVIALVTVHPKAPIWISQAVQAEFGGAGIAEDMPVETARPDMTAPMRTVHAR